MCRDQAGASRLHHPAHGSVQKISCCFGLDELLDYWFLKFLCHRFCPMLFVFQIRFFPLWSE